MQDGSDEVLHAAREAGLGAWAEWAARSARPSLRLLPDGASPSEHGTHLGGDPLLPEAFDWPGWHDVPMSFIAQISLTELADHADLTGLPADGLLSFFYDSEQSTWGFEPADGGSALVRWFPSTIGLRTRPSPPEIGAEGRFRQVDLTIRREWTVPPFGSLELEWDGTGALPAGQTGPRIELESMMRLEELLGGEDRVRHRMFGYPDQIQNEMRTECEFVTNGISKGDSWYLNHPRRAELEMRAPDWLLLLQVDNDDDMGTMWGDGGRIYYWIRDDALTARTFDRTWLMFQGG